MIASNEPSMSVSMEVDAAPIDECKDRDDGALIHSDNHVNDSSFDSSTHAHHGAVDI